VIIVEAIDITIRYVPECGYLPVVTDTNTRETLYCGEFRETPLIAFIHAVDYAKRVIPDLEEA
jgi:hypothetical protein